MGRIYKFFFLKNKFKTFSIVYLIYFIAGHCHVGHSSVAYICTVLTRKRWNTKMTLKQYLSILDVVKKQVCLLPKFTGSLIY